MLYLISSSAPRARLLSEANIAFRQIVFDYDEHCLTHLKNTHSPSSFVQLVLLEKQRQFNEKLDEQSAKLSVNFSKESLVFADSIACIKDRILTKPKDENQALQMLSLQSENEVGILSAFLLSSAKKSVISLSKTTLFLDKFNENHLQEYIKSKSWASKAGGIECEGFHAKYIREIKGEKSTAMGLDISVLKAYL